MADDPTPLQRAEDAVSEAIAKRAARTTDANPHSATPEHLKMLAEGVAAMKHGPQGGAYSNSYDGKYVSSTHSDDHRTDHQGEDRPKPPAGFGS